MTYFSATFSFTPSVGRLLLLGCLSLGVASAQAQQPKTLPKAPEAHLSGTGFTSTIGNEVGAYYKFDGRYAGLKGSPYLVPGWNPADLSLADGRKVQNVPIRYDVYSARLVVREGKDSLWLLPRMVPEFTMHDAPSKSQPEKTDRLFRAFTAGPTEELRNSFVEVLYEGPHYALFKYYRKKLVKADYSSAYSADRRFDELLDREEYYLRKPDGSVVEVKPSSKALTSAAPELEAKVKASKRSVKNENDLISLLSVIDTK